MNDISYPFVGTSSTSEASGGDTDLALVISASGTVLSCGGPNLPIAPLLGIGEVNLLRLPSDVHGPGEARASKAVSDFDWIFRCHFPGDPVLPGTMILDGIFQLMGLYSGYIGFRGRGRASRVAKVQFQKEVKPSNNILEYRIDVVKIVGSRQILICNGFATIDGTRCVTAENLVLTILKD